MLVEEVEDDVTQGHVHSTCRAFTGWNLALPAYYRLSGDCQSTSASSARRGFGPGALGGRLCIIV